MMSEYDNISDFHHLELNLNIITLILLEQSV